MPNWKAGLVAVLTALSAVSARGQVSPDGGGDRQLAAFLRQYLAQPNTDSDTTTRFIAAPLPIPGKKPGFVVYVSGEDWCGSGGCTLLVLEPTNETYRVIGRTTITRLPIRLLRSTNHGYPDIAVWVAGGGIRPAYETRLSFDGVRYPSNPSRPPAERISNGVPGARLLGASPGRRLYPVPASPGSLRP